jgi:hypothetical protein
MEPAHNGSLSLAGNFYSSDDPDLKYCKTRNVPATEKFLTFIVPL